MVYSFGPAFTIRRAERCVLRKQGSKDGFIAIGDNGIQVEHVHRVFPSRLGSSLGCSNGFKPLVQSTDASDIDFLEHAF